MAGSAGQKQSREQLNELPIEWAKLRRDNKFVYAGGLATSLWVNSWNWENYIFLWKGAGR